MKNMKIYTCKICGEVYIGNDIPPSCPFCGVANKFLQLAHIWKDENNIELTDASKKNIEKALEIELSNTAFYRCAYNTLSNIEVGLMFKGLSKVEREHASVFRKILKPDSDPEVNEKCEDNTEKCLEESLAREKKAVEFYTKALSEATEPRLKEVFEAIMNTEKDHIELDQEMKSKLTK